jgi:hypothetical protein
MVADSTSMDLAPAQMSCPPAGQVCEERANCRACSTAAQNARTLLQIKEAATKPR